MVLFIIIVWPSWTFCALRANTDQDVDLKSRFLDLDLGILECSPPVAIHFVRNRMLKVFKSIKPLTIKS